MRYDVIEEVNNIDCIVEVEKFNPYHDAKGRFSTADGYASFTYAPGKSKAHDNAIQRAKERAASGSKKPVTVQGKDLSGSFKADFTSGKSATMQAIEAQGFDGKPTVMSGSDFDKLVSETGLVGFRGIRGENASKYAEQLKTGEFHIQTGGGTTYGSGLYIATTSRANHPNEKLRNAVTRNARADAENYGKDAVITMTLKPGAKVGTHQELKAEFQKLSQERRYEFDNDVGAYAAAKGYDAYTVKAAGEKCDYTVALNRTAIVIRGD